MNTTLFLLLFGLLPYVIDIVFVGFALAYFIQKRGKAFSWFPAIPVLMLIFALNDLYIIPFLVHIDATFTIRNPEIAQYLGTSENESLTEFIMSDLFDLMGWFISSIFAFGFSLQLTKSPANE
jgi:hypothetical protein